MLATVSKYRVWFGVLVLCAAGAGPADDTAGGGKAPAAARARERESPPAAVATLRRSHAADHGTFVVQRELDPLIAADGGGACPSAAAVDAMQALRVMAGLDRLPIPHQAALAAFAEHPALLRGRLTNEQFVELVRFYQAYLGGHRVGVNVESAPNSGYRTHKKTWPEADGPDLGISPGRCGC